MKPAVDSKGDPSPADLPERTVRDRSFTRWGLPAVVFALGAAVALSSFTWIHSRERDARRLEFERQAARIGVAARVSFDMPLEVLRSVPALFEASDDVTREEFRAFVRGSLSRYSWIYALEWVPRVPGNERAKYEAAAVADGLVGYHFKQDAPSGPPVLASARPEYFPLYYMEPPNPTALGIEETALDVRRVALERARDSGSTVVTERLKLVQDAPSVVSVIAFHPIYRRGERPATIEARQKSLRGLAAVVFRVQPVVETAMRDVDLEAFDVVLLDADAAESKALLYESRAHAHPFEPDRARYAHEANIAGRRWQFVVADRRNQVGASPTGWAWLGGGLVASVLAGAFAHALRSIFGLRRQVQAARKLGQYTLVEKLGEGGMGTVYRAHHAMLRRPTAIKLVHAGGKHAQQDPQVALARFEREVQLTSALTHPNTVVVYDYGRTEDGVFYYAMEYIEGATLQELVDYDGPQPPERVIVLVEQIAAALAEAHAIGLVHRDVKPANVMLCNRGGVPDFVKVLDFGLAKAQSDASASVTQASAVIGTPLYLAPEAFNGNPIDARTDVYALGAVAYYLVTGAPVFTGRTVVEICTKHLSIPPDPLSKRLAELKEVVGLGPGTIHPELEALIMRCLAKKPDERPASAEELLRELRAIDMPRWSHDEADGWWRTHGASLDQHVKEARARREQPAMSSTIEVDALHRRDDESLASRV